MAHDGRTTEGLRTRGLTKSFGGPPVVRDVDIDLRPAEVHAIVGENGAGKSTLLKLLAGVHQPDAGEVIVDGNAVAVTSPTVARSLGISLIFQEPTLFPDLTVAENIFMGRHPVTARLPMVRWRTMLSRAAALMESIGARIDPARPVGELSVAEQQLVEIATALSHRARFVLMDEPTASLTPREVDRLFAIIRDLKARGASVVFVNHRLEEVFAIADRITVMRDGAKVGTWAAGELSRDEVVKRMVGRELGRSPERPHVQPGEVALEVEDLTAPGRFRGVSLSVRRGEIVAMAGLVGAGRTEVARALFGIDSFERGTVKLNGQAVRFRSPREALRAGLAYLPEDRQHQGLIQALTVAQNMTLTILGELSRGGWLDRRREQELARRQVERLQVKTPSVNSAVQNLSGGNQQKVLVGKFLIARPKVLILDEPTRGVDVGAKAEIHRLIVDLAAQGMAVLVISSDLPEVLALADRVIVMRAGQVAGELSRDEATEESIMRLAVGTGPTAGGRKAL
ncbi:MAG: sugar ABC transporter ATP-binding protein [Firmicutes bacterium]|nr:sugar ABC transporter ATP-binding protein [Bacillota bacterium]